MEHFKVLRSTQVFVDNNMVEVDISETLDDHINILIKDHRGGTVRLGFVGSNGDTYYFYVDKIKKLIEEHLDKL